MRRENLWEINYMYMYTQLSEFDNLLSEKDKDKHITVLKLQAVTFRLQAN